MFRLLETKHYLALTEQKLNHRLFLRVCTGPVASECSWKTKGAFDFCHGLFDVVWHLVSAMYLGQHLDDPDPGVPVSLVPLINVFAILPQVGADKCVCGMKLHRGFLDSTNVFVPEFVGVFVGELVHSDFAVDGVGDCRDPAGVVAVHGHSRWGGKTVMVVEESNPHFGFCRTKLDGRSN